MRITKIAATVVAALSGLLLAAPASAGQPYPPGPPHLTVSPAVIAPGGTVTVSGTNFGPNDLVTIAVQYTGGAGDAAEQATDAEGTGGNGNGTRFTVTVRADANGSFTTSITLRRPGVARLTATGRPSGIRASARVTVLCEDHWPGRPRCDNGVAGPVTPPSSVPISWGDIPGVPMFGSMVGAFIVHFV